MIEVDPICAGCYAVMLVITVHHKHTSPTRHPYCPACRTGRHLDLMDLPMPERGERGRHLRAVR